MLQTHKYIASGLSFTDSSICPLDRPSDRSSSGVLAGQWLGGDRRKADPTKTRCGLPRCIGPCEDAWWYQSPDEGLSARVVLEDHLVLFQCAVWLIDWLELFVLSYRKLSRSCAALRMTSLSSMFACVHAIHAAHHSMSVCFVCSTIAFMFFTALG